MIKNIILINSANFNFLDVNLEKDLFFLGDNGSGKTTVIRAIHYLFSGDVRNLGIPVDKDGFKEYYFRYPNSYMIYIFEDFFIFMYKTGSEIVKIFSKQKFEISKVIGEDSKLFDLDIIKKYAKTPNMKKTVKSLSEYRDIIYGNDKRYLDFKFTSIKNSSVFLGLFNEIFNIDKSIIDSKSIKRAIQTTLEYEKKVIDFNHDSYLQDIYRFQTQYRFFREFEKQKETIESAFETKNRLLSFENEINGLLSAIKYVYEVESRLLQESSALSVGIDRELSIKKRFKSKRLKALEFYEEKFRVCFNDLKLDIQRIERLKNEFSEENILLKRDIADQYEIAVDKLRVINEAYIKLKSGFESEIDSINSEIKSLQYTRDKELQRELIDKKDNQKKFLKSKLNEKIESEELSLKTREGVIKIDTQNLREEIKVFEKDIVENKKILESLDLNFEKSSKLISEEYEKKESKKKDTINTNNDSIDSKHRTVKNLYYEIEELMTQREKELALNKSSYEDEHRRIAKEIQKYQTMIEAKAGSFKEFLNEEVDGWESELYPILDDELLDMSLDTLSPKLLTQDRLIALELNRDSLKSMLTKDEAQSKIDAYKLEAQNLKISYDESIEELEKNYNDKEFKIEESITLANREIEYLKREIESLQEKIVLLTQEQHNELHLHKQEYLKKRKIYRNSINTFEEEILYTKEEIDKLEDGLRKSRRELINRIKDLELDFNEELQSIYEELDGWLKKKREEIESLIEVQESKKESISKDERIQELQSTISELEAKIKESTEANIFLDKYEEVKNDLDSLLERKNSLENLQLRYKEFKSRVEQRVENYRYEIDELSDKRQELTDRDKLLKKGLKSFEVLAYDFSEVIEQESSMHLYELVDSYKKILLEYKNQKIDLKSILDKINRLKNMHKEIDFYFNFDEYDEYLFLSQSLNIIAKIDEVYGYKNKILEIEKESGHKKFINFVNNALPQKMSVLNDSEDQFLSQVAKINKNLSSIDFGVIQKIRLETSVGDKKSIAKLLSSLNNNVATLSSLLNENSLFYEQSDVLKELNNLEMKFKEIKQELKGSSISLDDTIDLTLSFYENSKLVSQVSQLKNESSTGGSMLLKIAIAISILQLFIKEQDTPFFLIVDEVSRLHSHNQEKLRKFANEKGFSIVFVTPEPTYSKPEYIKYYRFQKNSVNEFEAIELNV